MCTATGGVSPHRGSTFCTFCSLAHTCCVAPIAVLRREPSTYRVRTQPHIYLTSGAGSFLWPPALGTGPLVLVRRSSPCSRHVACRPRVALTCPEDRAHQNRRSSPLPDTFCAVPALGAYSTVFGTTPPCSSRACRDRAVVNGRSCGGSQEITGKAREAWGAAGSMAGACLLPRRLVGREFGVDRPVEVLDDDLGEHGDEVFRVERDALDRRVHRKLAVLACRKEARVSGPGRERQGGTVRRRVGRGGRRRARLRKVGRKSVEGSRLR